MSRRTPSAATQETVFAADATRQVLDRAEADALLSTLTDAERARWSRLERDHDRDDYVAARILLRLLLAERQDVTDPVAGGLSTAPWVQICDRCGGPHGRPRLVRPGPAIAWAHSAGFVAVAVGPGSLGIDVEPAAATVPGRLPVQAWVRGEALVKWGHGSVDEIAGWASRLSGPGTLARQYAGGRVTLTDFTADYTVVGAPFVGCVAAATVARRVDVRSPSYRL